jgi:hypothetical protein
MAAICLAVIYLGEVYVSKDNIFNFRKKLDSAEKAGKHPSIGTQVIRWFRTHKTERFCPIS